MQAIEVRDHEIERRLESYARARLSPDPQAVARTRARLMREARLQFEAARIATHLAPVERIASHRSMTRRMAMPFLAAGIWLGIAVGSISAAQAGGPLYQTRMWVENATLPSSGVSRANAELGRLDNRLAEAVAGAAHGDAAAVQAALDAYRVISDDALAATTGDETLESMVSAALDKHQAVLTAVAAGLTDKGNDTAAAAVEASLQRAIDRNQAAIDRITTKHAGGAGNGQGNGGGASQGGGSGAGGNNPNGGGAGTGAGGAGGAGGTGTDPGAGGPDGTTGGGAGGTGDGNGNGNGDGNPEKTPKPTPDPPNGGGNPDHTPRGPKP